MANQVLAGYLNLQDLGAERVTGSLIPVISDAITQAVAEHNRQLNALYGLFVQRTTLYTERYQQVGAARLQSMDADGRALPVKPSGHYDLAYPILQGGTAWGANYVTRAKMTVAEVDRTLAMLLMADIRWVRDHILSALFTNTTWTYTDPLYGALTIQPLANGDSVTYQMVNGSDAGATTTSFLDEAGDIDATNPYPLIRAELAKHPENGGQFIVFIASAQKTKTTALATFYPVADGNLRVGADGTVLTGGLSVPVPGTLLGYEESGVFVVEWPFLPSGYMIGVATDGPRPLAMREDPEPELQGFRQIAERPDYPFWESQWIRRAGFGARNRVGAVVMKISDATYDIPTGYTAPMP